MKVNLKSINQIIKLKALNKGSLANKLGICRSTFDDKLNGITSWKVEEIGKLSKILDVSPFSLLENDGSNYQVLSNDVLTSWYDMLLDGEAKSVIKSIAKVLYGDFRETSV